MRNRSILAVLTGGLVVALSGAASDGPAPKATSLRFEVTLARGLLKGPTDGRVLVVLARDPGAEPRKSLRQLGMDAPPVFGADARGLTAGPAVVLDQRSVLFPLAHLSRLPPGKY